MESETTDTVRIGGIELRFLVDETQGSGDLVIFEMTVHPECARARRALPSGSR